MSIIHPLPDASTIAAAAAGDRLAFRRVYDLMLPRVTAQVVRLVGPGPDVDDVLQEAFVALFRALPSYRYEAAFSTWTWRIVYSATIDHLRRRRRPVDFTALQWLQGPTQDWGRLGARDQLRLLHEALSRFPDDAREAFLLFEVEGLSLDEIAQLQAAPLQTVAARIRRTRERLRGFLQAAEADAPTAQRGAQ